MARKLKEKYVLIDEQDELKLILHVAFDGKDNIDQVICELPESAVLKLVKRDVGIEGYPTLPNDFEIDGEVRDYMRKKYSF